VLTVIGLTQFEKVETDVFVDRFDKALLVQDDVLLPQAEVLLVQLSVGYTVLDRVFAGRTPISLHPPITPFSTVLI